MLPGHALLSTLVFRSSHSLVLVLIGPLKIGEARGEPPDLEQQDTRDRELYERLSALLEVRINRRQESLGQPALIIGCLKAYKILAVYALKASI